MTAPHRRPKVVLLGMLTRMPVGGPIWLMRQYALGFERLGYDVYYVEAHAQFPTRFMEDAHDYGTKGAVAFVADVMHRFGMNDRWAYHALHDDGMSYGLSSAELRQLYRDAALIINMHGGTVPTDEQASSGRLVYMGTDPVKLELELYRGEQQAIDFLEPHVAFFTWALNYGNPDCILPWCNRFPFVPSAPPVVIDLWENMDAAAPPSPHFTTVGNWRQRWHDVTFQNEVYTWSKDVEFGKVISLPQSVTQSFELALGSYDEDDRRLLEEHGWHVRSAPEISRDTYSYREYICSSRGEFTAAKDQNVRLRTGWFSERSATYLAAGRPVVQQDTAFGNAIPTGAGLLAFTDLEDAAAAVDEINSDYERHRHAARDLAREFFNYDVVLGNILDHLGMEPAVGAMRRGPGGGLPPPQLPEALDLAPVSRRPLQFPAETVATVRSRAVPQLWPRRPTCPAASIVIATWDGLTVTRMAIESVLANTSGSFEVIIVDNASTDGTRDYLSVLAAKNQNVRLILNETNRGFPGAVNQGLTAATGAICVVLNNDTIVTPGWLDALAAHASDPAVGLVGPRTNRCGSEAEIPVRYRTYGDLLEFARNRRRAGAFEVRTSTMFCTVMRRAVFQQLGPLDERFGIGMFEDDDYSLRARRAGLKVLCAEDAFVHHFGEASLGQLVSGGAHSELFRRNRKQFEQKWEVRWKPLSCETAEDYLTTVEATCALVRASLPDNSAVLIVSKGDDSFLEVPNKSVSHFPMGKDGDYAGHHPAHSEEAVVQLEELRADGYTAIVFPAPYFWWLDFYNELRQHLDSNYDRVVDCDACVIYSL